MKIVAFHREKGGGGSSIVKPSGGCARRATRKGKLFQTSSLAKGILFGNFSQV